MNNTKKAKSEDTETTKPLDKITIYTLNAYLASHTNYPDRIHQLFLWMRICSGRVTVEFCTCAHCKLLYAIFFSFLSGKGDYDIDSWKEARTYDLEGKEFPIPRFMKASSSPKNRKKSPQRLPHNHLLHQKVSL